ncbi:MAG: Hsp20/alpha crystallin family protein [Saprospiraceae bacterium]|jgi:HSP20 family protein|uniref:Hsp20/alpha crystallin family protein n=1 Tax=Candidatus Brachybacter algidus TaxID=2982024 RepID=UPI001B5796FD|nr:Hsp20/alpha crystallin family protein [Candidatus Brachybacter algidus]MBP7539679.1 Hsp20/alpha crystallin family protein [Saprospiraceae bacterium]MBK6448388.1 Hsp20/alpha crystallin family protein [Candidatus Brachybacter algidus]MBK8354124.1 Hsp20/alpha crystallin family protein [Candidatus Brachybacter algidus]MBK9396308.1 Hsp20/alpha crystallin family protein [Candidatus Brachybacter algidus]MBP8892766.1 Hsp20/alpha crystallin family protein [Saprospiraceae bacterium]
MENYIKAGYSFRPYKNVDSFFNQGLNNFWSNDSIIDVPQHNVKSTGESYIIELSAPGLEKDQFDISIEDNTLTIKVDRKKSTEQIDMLNPTYLKKEFSFEKFTRRFQLDKNISKDNLIATYVNGILSITLAKKNIVDSRKKIEIA